ncbi:MAG: biopolymer transporter Tol [Actinobacteria bacterium HGW-Actinobacteria-4]|nr:MAG: biopolymer transporter Tol [Actinobacteria bacterium HGW-Actinobacteria-4]
MPRKLRPCQSAQLYVLDVASGESTLLFESSTLLFEAPNWSPDGNWLVINGDGNLYRFPVDGSNAPEQIDLAGVPEINNDHVISPDGRTVYVSAEDGHIYAVPLVASADATAPWGGSHRRVSNDRGDKFRYYLHGISPDGATLAYIGLRHGEVGVTTNVFTIPAAGGPDTQYTDDDYPDDGAEFSPDGQWIYFNSERAGLVPGHAQLFRMPAAGGKPEQLTHDDRVNWFPHVSPDGKHMVYISFPPGTLGHPADLHVSLRLLPPDGDQGGTVAPRELVRLFGGQGTINVPSWDPTSTKFAYVAYPIE